MLEMIDGAIRESAVAMTAMNAMQASLTQTSGCDNYTSRRLQANAWPYQTYWHSYPVYICTDKTAKAIEVLKALQAEKILRCDSVPRFIALVEKISGLL